MTYKHCLTAALFPHQASSKIATIQAWPYLSPLTVISRVTQKRNDKISFQLSFETTSVVQNPQHKLDVGSKLDRHSEIIPNIRSLGCHNQRYNESSGL